MRALAGLGLLLLVLPAVDAATTEVAFSTPASFVGTVEVEDPQWVLLVFPAEDWSARAALEGTTRLDEFSYLGARRPTASGDSAALLAQWSAAMGRDPTHPGLAFRPAEAWGSLFIRADDVVVTAREATVTLDNGPDRVNPIDPGLGAPVPPHAFRPHGVPEDRPFLTASGPVAAVEVRAEGLRSLEARGVEVTCGGWPCVRSTTQDVGDALQRTAAWRWSSEGGNLTVLGRHVFVWSGGEGVHVSASGSVRLPDLHTETDLEQLGVSVHGQTLRGRGGLTLRDLHTSPDRTAEGRLSTDLVEARLDESPMALQAASVSAAATATLLAVLLWKGKALASALAGLFTRMDLDAALEHPNRRALFDYVDENPGTTFRELIRATGMAAGTARHHLMVLTRCDVLIERPFGQTLRYFHCDQAQVGDWDAVVVLREPELERMYRWLLDHPGVMQREVLDAAESWGWRRSTAQHRLRRLVQNDLASVRDLGRSKEYRARVVDVR